MKLTITAVNRKGEVIGPKTKKTHPQLILHMKHPVLIPSAAYLEWERAALNALVGEGVIAKRKDLDDKVRYVLKGADAIKHPVNCKALIYREALRGDAVGYYQAIGDFLQLAGIVTNDRLIVSWDGTRLLKDASRPRVELELTKAVEYVQAELFAENDS